MRLALALAITAALVGVGGAAATDWLPMPKVEFTVNADSDGGDGSKTVTTDCAAGTTVIGGGASSNYHQKGDGGVERNPTTGMAAIRSITLHARPTQGTAAQLVELGAETGNGIGNYAALAYALCTTLPLRLTQVARTSPSNSIAVKSVTVPCPAKTTLVAGGGGVVSPKGSEAAVILQGITPKAAAAAVKKARRKKGPLPASVTATAAEVGAGTPGAWTVTAQAVCAAKVGLPAFEIVVARAPSTDGGAVRAQAPCRPGFTPAGALGSISGSRPGSAALVNLNASGSGAVVEAEEIPGAATHAWGVVATAFCIAIRSDL
jgi:hypothetical protein